MDRRRTISLTALAVSFVLACPVAADNVGISARKIGGGAPPVVPMIGDVNRDCLVNVTDLTAVLGAWHTGQRSADFNRDGTVDTIDRDIVLAVWGTTCATRLVGDVNGDGRVNVADLVRVLGYWQTAHPQADVNGDGLVNGADRDMVLGNWGATLGRRLLGDHTGNDVVNIEDLIQVLGQWQPVTSELELDLLLANWGATSGRDVLGDVNGDKLVDKIDQDLVLATWDSPWAQADVNADGVVGIDDLITVNGRFGKVAGEDLPGDVNGDWIVDRIDQQLVLATWSTGWTQADVNRDGAVDVGDLLIVNGGWGLTHGQLFAGDVTGDCVVDQRDQDILLAGWGDAFLAADLNRDATVNVTDLTTQLANWGNTCP